MLCTMATAASAGAAFFLAGSPRRWSKPEARFCCSLKAALAASSSSSRRSAPQSAHMAFIRVGWLHSSFRDIRSEPGVTVSPLEARNLTTLPALVALTLTTAATLASAAGLSSRMATICAFETHDPSLTFHVLTLAGSVPS